MAALQTLSSRMEKFITNNEMLKQTELISVFHEAEIQQKVAEFIDTMHNKYTEDTQFKYIINQVEKDEYRPLSIENPFKSTRIAGYMAKMFNWIRTHEIQVLREQYEKGQELVANARSTGRRRDINKALEAAQSLRKILAERYEGRLWHEETVAGSIDPRLKRTGEDLKALTELKGNITEFIKVVQIEFDSASKHRTVEDEK
jgi:hypothetical protein